MSEDKLVLD